MSSQDLLSTLLLSSPNLRYFFIPVPITQALKADRLLISSLKPDMMNKTAFHKGQGRNKRRDCPIQWEII